MSESLFHDIFAEVLEDFALVEAIREGRETGIVSRAEIDTLIDTPHALADGTCHEPATHPDRST